jgi:hypothetical protein
MAAHFAMVCPGCGRVGASGQTADDLVEVRARRAGPGPAVPAFVHRQGPVVFGGEERLIQGLRWQAGHGAGGQAAVRGTDEAGDVQGGVQTSGVGAHGVVGGEHVSRALGTGQCGNVVVRFSWKQWSAARMAAGGRKRSLPRWPPANVGTSRSRACGERPARHAGLVVHRGRRPPSQVVDRRDLLLADGPIGRGVRGASIAEQQVLPSRRKDQEAVEVAIETGDDRGVLHRGAHYD